MSEPGSLEWEQKSDSRDVSFTEDDDGIHPNLKLLSNSSVALLHTCPRKYYLYKMMRGQQVPGLMDEQDSIDLVFGSTVGVGVQSLLEDWDFKKAYMACFMEWNRGLDDDNGEIKKKTFWHSLLACDRFTYLRNNTFANCDLVYFNSTPAVELGFSIDCGSDFTYRGKLDAVLFNKVTGDLFPYEGKTTASYNVKAGQYQNLGQAIGYKLILDTIARSLNIPIADRYKVEYCVYETKRMQWTNFTFTKSHTQLSNWLRSLLVDIERIEALSKADYWPQHGESCMNFGKECGHLDTCGFSDKFLIGDVKDVSLIVDKEDDYPFKFKLEDLLMTLEEVS